MTANDVDDVLAWAAWAPLAPPSVEASDAAHAADLLEAHCLIGRYLERARCAGHPAPGGSALFDEIARREQRLVSTVRQQVAALREFVEAVGDPRVVVLKGMATYMVTGDRQTLRTGDVDIITMLEVEAEGALLKLGYERTRPPFMHELGEFVRSGVEIDLHHHFPIYRRPADLAKDDLRPSAHPGAWIQRHRLAVKPARVENFLASHCPGRFFGATGLSFAGPELLAVVLAGHSFMNYTNAWSISHREKPYVRLGELVDIEALVSLPIFDRARFESLSQELDAGDALTWVNIASEALLGRTIVRGISSPRSSLPPRCLWWDLWIDAPPAPRTVLRNNWLDVAALVDVIGANRVGYHNWFRSGPRVLQTSVASPPFEARLDRGNDSILVTLRVPLALIGRTLRARVDAGVRALEWVGLATADEAGGIVQLELSLDLWPAPKALLLGVATTAPDGETDEATLVPLLIEDG